MTNRTRAGALVVLLRRRLARALAISLVAFLVATSLVLVLEQGAEGSKIAGPGDALWFGVVTVSTVGYGDLYPVTPGGRLVTGAFILITLMTIGLLLTAVSETLQEVQRMDDHGLLGTRMEGHTVVCGFGPLARTAIQELLAAGRRVAVLCGSTDEVALARQLGASAGAGAELFVTLGEPSPQLLRERLNLAAARTAVVALPDDARTLIACLNVRAVSASLAIVVALQREELRQTLISSGVTYVATPNELGGRLVASAAFEPQVAQLVEDLASGITGDCDLQQLPAGGLAGLTVAAARARLEGDGGPLLIGLGRRTPAGYEVVPHPPRELAIGGEDLLLVIARQRAAPR